MELETVSVNGAQFAVQHVGQAPGHDVHIVWGHGWGHSRVALLPIAESLAGFASSSVIDFPGFGDSPAPPECWGTAEYADAVAEWLRGQPSRWRFWVGHSFGSRIGIQIASRHPGLLDGMVLIAAAGLPRHRNLLEKSRFFFRRWAYKAAKLFVPEGPARDRLRSRFGSSDYQSAGSLRPIFVKVVTENLSDLAQQVSCPVLLVYGDKDKDTPLEIGERFNRLIPNSKLTVLQGLDHHTILGEGRHQLARLILNFLEGTTR